MVYYGMREGNETVAKEEFHRATQRVIEMLERLTLGPAQGMTRQSLLSN